MRAGLPRWTEHLVHAIELRGGLALVLLTHRDDVADAARYRCALSPRIAWNGYSQGMAGVFVCHRTQCGHDCSR
jgi:hypothetical protein